MSRKCMTIEDFRELCRYIDTHHSFRTMTGKMVKYISPTCDMRTGEIFHVALRRSNNEKEFSLTNEHKDKDLKKWIIEWLDHGEW